MPYCLYHQTDPTEDDYNKQIKNYSQITRPATRYVFVEAAELRNYNASHHFVMASPEETNLTVWGWWGPMAVNHGNASVLGFCDGHAETRKWRDPYTIERVDKLLREGVAAYGKEYPPEGQTQDIDYMAAGWAYRHLGN
jgi:prepilin-type processing-associated H-X9-DG protein